MQFFPLHRKQSGSHKIWGHINIITFKISLVHLTEQYSITGTSSYLESLRPARTKDITFIDCVGSRLSIQLSIMTYWSIHHISELPLWPTNVHSARRHVNPSLKDTNTHECDRKQAINILLVYQGIHKWLSGIIMELNPWAQIYICIVNTDV